MSFNINTNFNVDNFNSSIADFNKIFNSQLDNANSQVNEFSDIFNSMNQAQVQANQNPLFNQFVGMDSINAQKIENISPTEKMAQDIKNGFSNSLNELNTFERKAQDDLETFASGGDISVHEVMISSQKSNLAMQMAIQLRNQMLNAYNEFKGMQI